MCRTRNAILLQSYSITIFVYYVPASIDDTSSMLFLSQASLTLDRSSTSIDWTGSCPLVVTLPIVGPQSLFSSFSSPFQFFAANYNVGDESIMELASTFQRLRKRFFINHLHCNLHIALVCRAIISRWLSKKKKSFWSHCCLENDFFSKLQTTAKRLALKDIWRPKAGPRYRESVCSNIIHHSSILKMAKSKHKGMRSSSTPFQKKIIYSK